MTPRPSREALRSGFPTLLRTRRNWTKADLLLWEEGGQRVAVKDYTARPVWVRSTLGRLSVSRECSAYARLSGIVGIPPFLGRIDEFAFAVGFVEGRDLSTYRRGEVPAEFFGRLSDLLAAVHGRGVAHGDLHHRDVLVGPAGSPFLVDFSTAFFSDAGSGRIRRFLFRAACQSDRRSVLKLKRRHAPETLTEEENRDLDHPPAWYRVGTGVRLLRGRGKH